MLWYIFTCLFTQGPFWPQNCSKLNRRIYIYSSEWRQQSYSIKLSFGSCLFPFGWVNLDLLDLQWLYYVSMIFGVLREFLWHKNLVYKNCENHSGSECVHVASWPTAFEISKIHQLILEELQYEGREIHIAIFDQFATFSLKNEQQFFNLTSLNLLFLKIGLMDFRFLKGYGSGMHILKPSRFHKSCKHHKNFIIQSSHVQFKKNYWKGGKRVIKIKFQIIFSNGGNWVFEMRKRVFEKEEIKSLKFHTYEKSVTFLKVIDLNSSLPEMSPSSQCQIC